MNKERLEKLATFLEDLNAPIDMNFWSKCALGKALKAGLFAPDDFKPSLFGPMLLMQDGSYTYGFLAAQFYFNIDNDACEELFSIYCKFTTSTQAAYRIRLFIEDHSHAEPTPA